MLFLIFDHTGSLISKIETTDKNAFLSQANVSIVNASRYNLTGIELDTCVYKNGIFSYVENEEIKPVPKGN